MNRVLVRWLLVAGLSILLAGCQTIGGWFSPDDAEPPADLVEFEPAISVTQAWSTRVGRGVDRSAPRLRPFHEDGKVWVADHRGNVVALDRDSGREIRSFTVDIDLSSGPAVFGDLVLLGGFDGELLVLDAETGNERWSARLSSEVLALPVLEDGVVIARSIDGRTYGFDVADGSRLWVHDHGVPRLTLRGLSDPLVRGGIVYLGHSDGKVSAMQVATGDVVWEQRISSGEGRTELERLADIDGNLFIVGTDLFASSYHGRTVSMALESGRTLWVKELPSHSGVIAERTRLAATDRNDHVYLVDRRNGSTLWQNDRMERRQLTRPSFHDGYLVVGDKQGYLHWMDLDSGDFVYRARATRNDRFTGPPLVVGSLMITHSADGTVAAWRIDS